MDATEVAAEAHVEVSKAVVARTVATGAALTAAVVEAAK
jgi:hypothetical protein